VSYQIIERDGDRGFYDNTSVYEVPEGHYFMMGDNRDNSTDSRVASVDQGVGYVPLENFVGRAELVFFSVEEGESVWQFWRWPVSLRWSRLFTPVR
jgi:signal peptidase I